MLVDHVHKNEVELVLHKHMSNCYMGAELVAIIRIYLLSELSQLAGNEFTGGKWCKMHLIIGSD